MQAGVCGQPYLFRPELSLPSRSGRHLLVCLGRGEQSTVLELEGLQLLAEGLILRTKLSCLHLLTLQQPQELSVLIRQDLDLLVFVGILELNLHATHIRRERRSHTEVSPSFTLY